MLRTTLWVIACAFPISEIALAIFKRAGVSRVYADRRDVL